MNYIKIDYDKAIEMQNSAKIMLIDISGGGLKPVDNEYGQLWKDNFSDLQIKVPHISPDKILNFLSAKYVTEVLESKPHGECFQYTWRYLYGVENKHVKLKVDHSVDYVYILVNPGYPSLVKVGITTKDINARVTSINATGTVYEWVPRFAVAVSKGNAYKIEQQVHKALAHVRVSSDAGNSREFFEIDALTALDIVREVGILHVVGNVIVF
jgi:hypothetical protein